MSDEGRRVFPMETTLGVLAGKDGNDVLDFLGYAVQREVCECARPAVAPMVKGWLYSLNPEFMKDAYEGVQPYDSWVAQQKQRLGDNVSITPLPAADQEAIGALLDMLETAEATAEEKTAEAEAAQAELKALAPFKAKAAEFEKKAAQLEEKNKALTAEVGTLKAELAEFSGKVAINESEIEQSIKDMVSRAVKDALAALPVGAAVAGAAAGAAGAASDEFAAAAGGQTDSQGAVPDTFGFGASGPSDDGFGF